MENVQAKNTNWQQEGKRRGVDSFRPVCQLGISDIFYSQKLLLFQRDHRGFGLDGPNSTSDHHHHHHPVVLP